MAEARAIERANGAAPKPRPISLRDLAERLTPNPALTIDGTLQIILDGIEKIDDEALARALGHAGARQEGMDVDPVSDEQWREADLALKIRLIKNTRAFKAALREMAQ